MNFSKKRLISFIAITFIVLAIPATFFLSQQKQIFKGSALQSSAQCTPNKEDGTPGDYTYSYKPGALEIYVSVIETNGAIGPIPGVNLRADKIDNNPGTGDNRPINWVDGGGCGFSAWGVTDGNGHVNLEPLNCAHNNFRVFHGDQNGAGQSGLPPDVDFDSSSTTFQEDGNNQNNVQTGVDISNLVLQNGYAGILKLYYRRKPTQPSTPTTGCYIGKACSVCGGNAGVCQPDCEGGWCNGGFCASCHPETTVTPTQPKTPSIIPACPVPNAVTNIHISCPYCP